MFPTQSRFDALCDTGFSGALNRQTTDMQRLLPLRIGPSRALWALIGLQTNAGSRQFVRGGFPLGNHREKIVSFLSDAGHFGAFGWHEPLLSRRAHPVSDVWMQDNSAIDVQVCFWNLRGLLKFQTAFLTVESKQT